MLSASLRLLQSALVSLACLCTTLPVFAESADKPPAKPDKPTTKADQRPAKSGQSARNPGQPSGTSEARPTQKAERSVQFEVAEERKLRSPGRRLGLTVKLEGESSTGKAPGVVAIFESPGMARVLVPMSAGPGPVQFQTTASLELPLLAPFSPPGESMNRVAPVPPQAVRIDVTFARIRGMKMEQLLKRTLYVTVGHAEGSTGTNEGVPSGRPANKAGARNAFIALDDDVPVGRGIKEETLFESDLLTGSPIIGGAHTYWQEISQRITHRWSERNRSVRGEKTTMPPRVRFRLYPDGAAQTIYIERSSGNQRVDDAGLESVVNTQPFQPFPAGLTDPYVDVHVDFSPRSTKR